VRARVFHSAAWLLGALLSAACSDDPGQVEAEFVVAVGNETFVMRVTDAETIRLAQESVDGRNQRFPIGPLRRGDGGFNAPWSWHFDPAEVRMTEIAIEVCDGRPSYVEAHLLDFPTYCPWSARVIRQR
jgi:hypothetical protein